MLGQTGLCTPEPAFPFGFPCGCEGERDAGTAQNRPNQIRLIHDLLLIYLLQSFAVKGWGNLLFLPLPSEILEPHNSSLQRNPSNEIASVNCLFYTVFRWQFLWGQHLSLIPYSVLAAQQPSHLLVMSHCYFNIVVKILPIRIMPRTSVNKKKLGFYSDW